MNKTQAGLAWMVAALFCTPALAQGTDRVYRLLPDSGAVEGCFAPCSCPLQLGGRLQGTMIVTLLNIGDVTDLYEIRSARFRSLFNNRVSTTYIGSGEYRVFYTSGTTWSSHLNLDMTVGLPTVITPFEGGPTPAVGGFAYPPISVTIDRNRMVCFDQVLTINAVPVSADWNRSGTWTVQDIIDFLADWFGGNTSAAYLGGPQLSVGDLFAFLSDWFDRR